MTSESQNPMDSGQYKEHLTGSPDGIFYRVEDAETGLVYNFDAFAGGQLIYTIADYAGQFGDSSPAPGSPDQDYIDTANLQVLVSQGYPIIWYVQSADDADKIRNILAGAGFPRIDVVHKA